MINVKNPILLQSQVQRGSSSLLKTPFSPFFFPKFLCNVSVMFTDWDAAFTSALSPWLSYWWDGSKLQSHLLEKPDWWQLQQIILRRYTVEQKWKSVFLHDFKERGKQLQDYCSAGASWILNEISCDQTYTTTAREGMRDWRAKRCLSSTDAAETLWKAPKMVILLVFPLYPRNDRSIHIWISYLHLE